jgi:hypothetical protein
MKKPFTAAAGTSKEDKDKTHQYSFYKKFHHKFHGQIHGQLIRGGHWIRIDFGQLNPDSHPHWECGSGSRRAKVPYTDRKK